MVEAGLGLLDLRFGLTKPRLIDANLRDGAIALVLLRKVVALGIVEGLLGDDAVFQHLRVAFVRLFVHRQVGGLGVDLVLSDVGRIGGHVRFRGGELSALRRDLGEDLLLIELREDLAFGHHLIDIDVELLHQAGRFGFELDFGDGLDRSCSDDGFGDVAARDFGKPRRRNLGIARAQSKGHHPAHKNDGDDAEDRPQQPASLAFTTCLIHFHFLPACVMESGSLVRRAMVCARNPNGPEANRIP